VNAASRRRDGGPGLGEDVLGVFAVLAQLAPQPHQVGADRPRGVWLGLAPPPAAAAGVGVEFGEARQPAGAAHSPDAAAPEAGRERRQLNLHLHRAPSGIPDAGGQGRRQTARNPELNRPSLTSKPGRPVCDGLRHPPEKPPPYRQGLNHFTLDTVGGQSHRHLEADVKGS